MGPKGLHIIRVTDVSLLVEWEEVKNAEYYLLSYYPYENVVAIQEIRVPNTENSYLITGLKPGVTYIVQVQAVIKGISSESDSITATTGKDFLYFAIFAVNCIQLYSKFSAPWPIYTFLKWKEVKQQQQQKKTILCSKFQEGLYDLHGRIIQKKSYLRPHNKCDCYAKYLDMPEAFYKQVL